MFLISRITNDKKSCSKVVIYHLFSDAEEGNVIANSHHGKHPGGVVDTEIPEPKSPTNEDMMPMGEGERSVLQAKLTNMAIQVRHIFSCLGILCSSREETDYRFEIIVYMHRIFQMFEFPLF